MGTTSHRRWLVMIAVLVIAGGVSGAILGVELTKGAEALIQRAANKAQKNKHAQLSSLHIADALFDSEQEAKGGLGTRVAEKAQVSLPKLQESLDRAMTRDLPSQDPPPQELSPSRDMSALMKQADRLREKGENHVGVHHLLLALLSDSKSSAASVLKSHGLTLAKVKATVAAIRKNRPTEKDEGEGEFENLKKYGIDLLERAEQGKLDPVIGRDDEIRRVVQVLSRRTKNNPVLLGEPGVGKTAIVEGLALRILDGDVPESLIGCRLISLDMGALVAGAKYHGEFEERLKSVLDEVQKAKGKVVLFIDEIHTVLGAGSSKGAMDAANLLKPMLARGELRCIGATTLGEYQKHVEKDPAFERRFQPVYVNEPSVEDSISILRGLRDRYESHHGVRIQDAAVVEAARLSHRYVSGRKLPDKAIDLLDEACANVRVDLDSKPEALDQVERKLLQLEVEAAALQKEEATDPASATRLRMVRDEIEALREKKTELEGHYLRSKSMLEQLADIKREIEDTEWAISQNERAYRAEKAAELKYTELPRLQAKYHEIADALKGTVGLADSVSPEHIAGVVSRWTGIPVSKLTSSEKEKVLGLEDRLKARVLGQDHAVRAVSDAIIRARAGLSAASRPIGSFLFLGPTGVGKTELAKALARELFDDEKNMIRIDMSEYMEQHSVARAIGSPPGYIGHDEGGQWTEPVRRRPYSVILFDEVEKAHRNVLNILLQVMDDGRLTDSKGRTVDFRNCVLILTSNVGADILLHEVAKSGRITGSAKKQVMQRLRSYFLPEFLNRADDIIMFSPLTANSLRAILDHQLDLATAKLRSPDRNVTVSLSPSASGALLAMGHDYVNGARPLRRLVERIIVTKLSKLTVAGDLPSNSLVVIDVSDDRSRILYRVLPPDGAAEVVYADRLDGTEVGGDEEVVEEEDGEGLRALPDVSVVDDEL